MANSLDLDPEWGAIDLLEEVEKTFGIQIANEEAERCSTMGDLYDVLVAHLPNWDEQEGSCGSSMIFYRLRRCLAPENKRRVTPATLLEAFGLRPSHLLERLARDAELRLPAHELTWLGISGGFLLLLGILSGIVALLTGHWMVSAIAVLIAFAGWPLLRMDPGRFPAGMTTVADLVRRTAPLNAVILKNAGARPSDLWSVLVALSAEHGRLPPDQIGPDTFFHRKSLELATAR